MCTKIIYICFFACILITSCNDRINIFSVDEDIQLGSQLNSRIENSTSFQILSEFSFSDLYIYLYEIKDAILISPSLNYNDKFDWNIKIIVDDSKKEAFSLPGGYLYLYTGLLKYLDNVDQLSAVIAHEIAHSDQRFIINKLANIHGYQKLMDVANGATGDEEKDNIIGSLDFVRYNIDEYKVIDNITVELLAITRYACDGYTRYIDKLKQTPSVYQNFIDKNGSTDLRETLINDKVAEISCDTSTWDLNGDNGQFLSLISNLP